MSLKHILFIYVIAAFFFFPRWGVAESDPPENLPTIFLDPTIITGTHLPTTRSKTNTSLTVISKERIKAEQEVSVTELLRQVPGLHIDQPGGRGGVGSVYIRGGDPNYTLVLIDGVRVNDSSNSRGGSFDFSSLNQDGIERIEVIRGGFSPIYGSDAMAGVVHILTPRGSGKPTMDMGISGGLDETYRLTVRAQGAYRFFDYSLSGSVYDNGKALPGDRLFTKTYHSKIGFRTEKWDIQTVFRFQSSEMESYPDDSGGERFSVLRSVEFRESEALLIGMDASYPVLSTWKVRFHFDYMDRDETIDSPGVAPGVRDPKGIPSNFSDNQFRRITLRQDHYVEISDHLQFSIGVEGQLEKGEHRGHLLVGNLVLPTQFRLERTLLAPFVEFQIKPWKSVLFTASARGDLPENFKSHLSHRIGLSVSVPMVQTKFRISEAKGFKLPSFFALGNPIVGNSGLIPEKSKNFDFEIEQPFWKNRGNLRVAYFYNQFKGAIDFQEGPPPLLVNRSKIISKGVEMEISINPVPLLNVMSHVTFLETDIKDTDEGLRNRPKWRGGVAIQWQPFIGLIIHLDTLYIGKVLDSSIPTGDRYLDDYTRVDLAITWNSELDWEYFLAVDNLFDADYEEAVGFPSPGIAARFGVKVSF